VATAITAADESSDTSCNVLFVTAATGDLPPKTGTNLTFNSSSGVLTATGFAGALTGNVTGNASGSSGSCTGNAATATILANTRAIGGVNFNGSAAINLPGVNTSGNQDTSGTAAIATAVTVADESSDTSCNVLFVTAATGDLPPKSGTNLTFNSSSGVLTATGFAGALTGNVTGTADVATVATTVTITDNESTDESNALIFTAGGDTDGGNLGLESDGTLTYNPSTGKITATGFVGALTGTADVATAVTVADESSDTSCNVLFVTAATGDLAPKSGTNLTFDSANGNLTTTTFTGTATNAQYADLAEMYAADSEIDPGTVVCFAGQGKVTACGLAACTKVAGIVSTDPAH
jgi:hypothetical protein